MDCAVDWDEFFRASNPVVTLDVGRPDHKKYYIDFSSVRGREVIEEIENTIKRLSDPTCQWFTGHIGCGKSTELLCLKERLQKEGFHVVYFQSTDYLRLEDVDVGAILLVIAGEISKSLGSINVDETAGFRGFLKGIARNLNIELEGYIDLPGIGRVTFDSGGAVGLAGGLYKIAVTIKDNSELRRQSKQLVGSQTREILNLINNELLKPAKRQLPKGIVVIVDNLERIPPMPLPTGQTLAEGVFVGGRDLLTGLCCHVVYTIPLELMFSMDQLALPMSPQVLPMVPIKGEDGSDFPDGIKMLRQMVLVRAFPDVDRTDLMNCITDVFDSPETLDRLCLASGGHMRQLLRLLFGCLQKRKELHITRENLEEAIGNECDRLAIQKKHIEILRQVAKEKTFIEAAEYPELFRGLLVFQYRNPRRWYDINPLLQELNLFKNQIY